jgi:hypothetical protein
MTPMAKTTIRLVALGAALAAVAVSPTVAAATVASPVRAVFLKEFSKSSYTMDQGQILVFENDDPFLLHGLIGGGGLTAPTISPNQTRLVRSAPFLGPGVYPFHDPAHPEMASSLTITSAGARLPADIARPTAQIKVLTPAKRAARSGRIKVRVTPSEPLDASIKAVGSSGALGVGHRTYPDALAGVLIIALDPASKQQARGGVQLKVKLTDAAGNRTKRTAALGAGGGGKKKR